MFLKGSFFLLVTCTNIFIVQVNCVGGNSGVESLAKQLNDLADKTLKFKDFQDYIKSLPYRNQELNGNVLLETLSTSLSAKFQSRENVVKNLRDAVEVAYSDQAAASEKCCQLQEHQLEYDSRFRQQVSDSSVCELVSPAAQASSVRFKDEFKRACIENLANVPTTKWQYFGSEQGVTTQFPANKAADCGAYDNRFRPWYIQANVPKPKQVVIVVDQSGSMRQTHSGVSYMELAKEAARTVVETLNPYDMFALVAFSSRAVTFGSNTRPNGECFKDSFAQATPQNKDIALELIQRMRPDGTTCYSCAIHAAFDFFVTLENKTSEDSYRSVTFARSALAGERVILFLSDGIPDSDDTAAKIMTSLRERNSELSRPVAMLTYGLGAYVDFSILQEMAGLADFEIGENSKTGIFTHIRTPSNLRNTMASYYNFFTEEGQTITSPIWTVPYLDSWGLGLMITAALPVYVSGSLAGVAAVDITIEELLAESSFFKPTELTYAFVINQAGLVISHPLFPGQSDGEPLLVEATGFERDLEFLSIFESMKKGESGMKSFISTRVLSEGGSRKYGITTAQVPSTYHWKKIPGTIFSICLVMAENDSQSVLAHMGSLAPGSFLYHRIHRIPPNQACQHSQILAAKDQSAVALAARAFQDPQIILSDFDYDMQTLVDYMEGRSDDPGLLKDGVRDSVVATDKAEKLWLSSVRDEVNKNVFWRYVATGDGTFRVFPGTKMPSGYDPVARGWFQLAQANREEYVITPPYRDAASGVSVVTMARALRQPNQDTLFGAIGVDIETTFFQELLVKFHPTCNDTQNYRCTLLDHAGFAITTEQYLANAYMPVKHITQLQPNIAGTIFHAGVMQPRRCASINKAIVHNTYKIAEHLTPFVGSTIHCNQFELLPINATNAYLLVEDKNSGSCDDTTSSPCFCNSAGGISNSPTCGYVSNDGCTCPCSNLNDEFHPCSNMYNWSSTSPRPCVPEKPDLSQTESLLGDVNDLPECYEIAFKFDRTQIPTLSEEEGKEDDGDTEKDKTGLIIFGIAAVALLLAGTFYKYTRGSNRRNQRVGSSPTNAVYPTTIEHPSNLGHHNPGSFNQHPIPTPLSYNQYQNPTPGSYSQHPANYESSKPVPSIPPGPSVDLQHTYNPVQSNLGGHTAYGSDYAPPITPESAPPAYNDVRNY